MARVRAWRPVVSGSCQAVPRPGPPGDTEGLAGGPGEVPAVDEGTVRIGAEMIHPALWCWFTAQLSRKRQISGVEVIEQGVHVPLRAGRVPCPLVLADARWS